MHKGIVSKIGKVQISDLSKVTLVFLSEHFILVNVIVCPGILCMRPGIHPLWYITVQAHRHMSLTQIQKFIHSIRNLGLPIDLLSFLQRRSKPKKTPCNSLEVPMCCLTNNAFLFDLFYSYSKSVCMLL